MKVDERWCETDMSDMIGDNRLKMHMYKYQTSNVVATIEKSDNL